MRSVQYVTYLLLASSCSLFCRAQNVGIGSDSPVRAKLEVGTASAQNQTTGLFGVNRPGISLQQNPPAIGFNQYLDASASNQSRWMNTGYALKQVFDPAVGSLSFRGIRSGIGENIMAPADEKLSLQLRYDAINGNSGFGINKTPQTVFHILYRDPANAASGAGISPYGIAGFESNIDAFVNLMSPTGYQNGILLGSGLSNIRGGLIYTHSTILGNESMALRTGGNINRVVISATGNMAVGDLMPLTKFEVDGALSLLGAVVNYFDVVEWPSGTLHMGNRTYLRININYTAPVAINYFDPGIRIGQLLIIEKYGSPYNLVIRELADNNIRMPGTSFTLSDNDNCTFIWNGFTWNMLSQMNND